MDGYLDIALYLEKIKIDLEIAQAVKEMNSIPQIPDDINDWVSTLRKNDEFNLADFKRIFKITKEYDKLIDKQENNARHIKILVIDNLVSKIKELLKD